MKIIWAGVILGGLVGQVIPMLWGADALSITAAAFSFLFGLLGLGLAYWYNRYIL